MSIFQYPVHLCPKQAVKTFFLSYLIRYGDVFQNTSDINEPVCGPEAPVSLRLDVQGSDQSHICWPGVCL